MHKRAAKRAGSSASGNPQVNIRFPEAVANALARESKKTKRTIQAVTLSILANHYGLDIAEPKRGRPPKNVE